MPLYQAPQLTGRELAGAESTANAFITPNGTYADISGVSMTVPAGQAWVCVVTGDVASVQNTITAGGQMRIQMRVVDSATSTTVYAYGDATFEFPATGGGLTIFRSVSFFRRQAALGSATAVKLQAAVPALVGGTGTPGNIGFAPAALGSAPPTTMQAIGR